ncbi:type II toxin-antitoxin system RelE/ParE family toxin [Levilactobacillus tongjiangensis]|uniref:Type II toxin-antitoxin system YafQ family toxin n=1 Tax=Levilactobacillus tongjiangensis TaxID=2486023 RepID=A0ABW1SVI0_9LACO|nr:type II toxin-antitoxin system YafQ family toxin [Levilactobacillus tongjiangensis]
MMKTERTSRFKREFKKLQKKHYPTDLLKQAILAILTKDAQILARLHDHGLHGQWQGYRELHPARIATSQIRGDLDGWILIYKISSDCLVLVLVATGDHQSLKVK